MSEPTTVQDLSDVLETLRNSIFRDLRVAFPATVNTFDATKGTVDVQPTLHEWYEDDSGAIMRERLAVIPAVPVLYPGGGGFRMTFPLSMGDTGLVIVSDRSLDKWLAGPGGEVDLDDDRKHDMSDAVFIPGLKTTAKPWNGIDQVSMTIGSDSQAAMAHAVVLVDKLALQLAADLTTVAGSAGTAAGAFTSLSTKVGNYTAAMIGSTGLKVKE